MSSENKKTEFTWDERVAMLVAKARKDLQKLKAAKKARDYICKMNAEKKKMDRVLRPFYTSQWLDVKDTDDKWLEAQIVDIHKTLGSARVHIHYKGYDKAIASFLQSYQFGVCVCVCGRTRWKTKYDEYLLLEECNDETSTVSERYGLNRKKQKPLTDSCVVCFVYFYRVRLAPYLSKSKPEAVGDGKVLPRPGMRVDVLDTTDHWRQVISSSSNDLFFFTDECFFLNRPKS